MYVKLFASLYQGTLRGCSDEILVFTNLLAHADMYGIVDKHWRAISEETGLPRDRVETAILRLESPDPESRSPEEEGRRIIRIDDHRAWGWRIVNYGKYREIRNADDRREQNREAQKRWREKNADSKQSKPRSAHAEAEAEAEAEAIKPLAANRRKQLSPDFKPNETGLEKAKALGLDAAKELERFRDHHTAKGTVMLDWQAAFRTWLTNAAKFKKPWEPSEAPKSPDKPINGMVWDTEKKGWVKA
jgi:hypothetical protein